MKNPAAVALGSIRSERKTAAARQNATRPRERKSSRYQMSVIRSPRGKLWSVNERAVPGGARVYTTRKEAHRWLLALRAKEREEKKGDR